MLRLLRLPSRLSDTPRRGRAAPATRAQAQSGAAGGGVARRPPRGAAVRVDTARLAGEERAAQGGADDLFECTVLGRVTRHRIDSWRSVAQARAPAVAAWRQARCSLLVHGWRRSLLARRQTRRRRFQFAALGGN